MADIEWSLRAIEDLQIYSDYLTRWSEAVADLHVSRITRAVESLADFPRQGTQVSVTRSEEVRQLVVRGNRVIYRIRGDVIRVQAVLFGSADLSREISRRPSDF